MGRFVSLIYISYSREDVSVASNIAKFLENAGHDVWIDSNLNIGQSYERQIERQLEASDFVLVLWSEASIKSRYVREEAHYAENANKLIAIRLDDADPPLPFRHLHAITIRNEYDFSEIADAVERLRAHTDPLREKPQDVSSRLISNFDRVLSWLGISGAVITFMGHLDVVIKIAKSIRFFFESWIELLVWFWSFLYIFDIKVSPEDAILLTISFLIAANAYLTSTGFAFQRASLARDYVAMLAGLVFVSAIIFIGYFFKQLTPEYGAVFLAFDFARDLFPNFDYVSDKFSSSLALSILALLLACIITLISAPFLRLMNQSLYPRGFSMRLWRMHFLLLLAIGVNELIKLLENRLPAFMPV